MLMFGIETVDLSKMRYEPVLENAYKLEIKRALDKWYRRWQFFGAALQSEGLVESRMALKLAVEAARKARDRLGTGAPQGGNG